MGKPKLKPKLKPTLTVTKFGPVYRSRDGKTWERREAQPVNEKTLREIVEALEAAGGMFTRGA